MVCDEWMLSSTDQWVTLTYGGGLSDSWSVTISFGSGDIDRQSIFFHRQGILCHRRLENVCTNVIDQLGDEADTKHADCEDIQCVHGHAFRTTSRKKKRMPMYQECQRLRHGIPSSVEAVRTLDSDANAIGIHGQMYDARDFEAVHPGGSVFLQACRGLDVTALFESTHLDIKRALASLAKLPVTGTYTPKLTYDFQAYHRARLGMHRLHPFDPSVETDASMGPGSSVAVFRMHPRGKRCPGVPDGAVDGEWVMLCTTSALLNAFSGAHGHSAIHRLHPVSLFLDWNGLSAYEWVLEHVVSHHPHVNTPRDHDALSMEPFLRWLPYHKGMDGGCARQPRPTSSSPSREVIVALQGMLIHRTRWDPLVARWSPRRDRSSSALVALFGTVPLPCSHPLPSCHPRRLEWFGDAPSDHGHHGILLFVSRPLESCPRTPHPAGG